MTIEEEVTTLCNDPAFRTETVDLLERLCGVDTTPTSDIAALCAHEQLVFGMIEDACRRCGVPGARVERRPIPAAVAAHPAFTPPYYATSEISGCLPPVGLVYGGRSNLVLSVDGRPDPRGHGAALNAHVDVVAPFIPPQRHGDLMAGRGTADDKGNVVAALAALRIIGALAAAGRVEIRNSITAMFVIDEEIGGNGSLALAMDDEICARFASLLVLECTGNVLHVANRGAVYLKAVASLTGETAPGISGAVSLPESCAFAVLEVEAEAARIRAESAHPLFPDAPVYFCPGILGPFGAHPSSVCGEVVARLVPRGSCPDLAEVAAVVEDGLARYLTVHPDRTREWDPAAQGPRLASHYGLTRESDGAFLLAVHGTTGHLGAMPRNDPAIVKWAYITRAIAEASIGGALALGVELVGRTGDALRFEGAQGFVPTHSIAQVSARVRAAFLRGLDAYLHLIGAAEGSISCTVTFDKLHNNAYVSDPTSPSVARALQAAAEAGMPQGPLVGWNASCDARLFADERPSLAVMTCGAGEISAAHSREERLSLSQLFTTVRFITLFLLRETGSCV